MNYQTHTVDMWITNNQDTYLRLMKIVHTPETSVYARAATLKKYVTEEYLKDAPTSGLVADLINAALADVDWAEIVQSNEEV